MIAIQEVRERLLGVHAQLDNLLRMLPMGEEVLPNARRALSTTCADVKVNWGHIATAIRSSGDELHDLADKLLQGG